MTARSAVVLLVLAKLDPYLDRLAADWLAQPGDDRTPTLPLTGGGKVNTRQLVRDLGLKETYEQHFYRKPELRGPVNAIAQQQGVKGIGSRLQEDEAYAGARLIVGRNAQEISELRRTLAEREALIGYLRSQIARLEARLDLIEQTGMTFRGGPTS